MGKIIVPRSMRAVVNEGRIELEEGVTDKEQQPGCSCDYGYFLEYVEDTEGIVLTSTTCCFCWRKRTLNEEAITSATAG